VLTDVSDADKAGLKDASGWITYFHAYRNTDAGWTIQYWFLFPFNTGVKVGPVEIGYHGGDWEMVSIVLDKVDSPMSVHSTGHTQIESVPWSAVQKNGTHPILYSERGGHEMHASPVGPPPYIVHPTWANSFAIFPGAAPQAVGPLRDMGSKLHPAASFVLYSGLWGDIGSTPISSGYWGPVFNETGMKPDRYLSAWCDGVADPQASENGLRECYPDDIE